MITVEIQQNRRVFIDALRSHLYCKGPITTDSKGHPVDPEASGYCAVGLAYSLFNDGTGSLLPIRKALGIKTWQFTKIQQDWNDSPLTFPEIADLIEQEMF